ncbi:hypothetical protein HOM13_03680 [Candidatus Woesearchaeota archaeon]|nr:hypothetical protein [Candidatus Woesearchaeota archaeon]MBT5215809.1 hypothetical protein [Candidatus Woesearchaeota archaeon]MBT6402284.1 hypothetical protein [Candidatus Woesearchaeota archaeon]
MTTKEYAHLTNSNILNFNRNLPPEGEVRTHRFYEGTFNIQDRELIFVLQKVMPNQFAFKEVRRVFSELGQAESFKLQLRGGLTLADMAREHLPTPAEIYGEYFVPEKEWAQHNSIASAVYNRFSGDADIIVPGFIESSMVGEHNDIVSRVQTVPLEKRRELEEMFEQENYCGKVTFW